jgi:hypothetical protein
MKARIEKQRIPEAESGGREYTRQCREKVEVLNEEAHNLLKPRQCYSPQSLHVHIDYIVYLDSVIPI